ncbi:hypothetical protein LguiB_035260 [Lonicera macranthoides]
MDFSSITGFLDPSKWQQQLSYQTGGSGSNPPPPPPPPLQTSAPQPPPPHLGSGGGSGGGMGSIRPGSMADRARMANIPMPEVPLKCPRCESTNTKFCYFNNYSLSQPRHFCKTCRRYWTRGGALRSVPVGGGCRRNKRTKGGGNKSPASSGDQQGTSSGVTSTIPSSSGTSNILGLASQFPQLRLMAPFGQLSDHQFGLNYGGMSAPTVTSEINYQMGSNNLFGESAGGVGIDQWRPQQFPFMGGLDPPTNGLYPFQGGDPSGYVGPKVCTSMISQMAGSVKMEDNNNNTQEMNLSRRLLGVEGNDHWGGGGWTDISGFSSSSTSNPL